jgi:DNA-directed RNA polymerase specialized sigma24 family protein
VLGRAHRAGAQRLEAAVRPRLSLSDVGARLGVSKQAVGKLSLKGLQALRECLAAREKGATA